MTDYIEVNECSRRLISYHSIKCSCSCSCLLLGNIYERNRLYLFTYDRIVQIEKNYTQLFLLSIVFFIFPRQTETFIYCVSKFISKNLSLPCVCDDVRVTISDDLSIKQVICSINYIYQKENYSICTSVYPIDHL